MKHLILIAFLLTGCATLPSPPVEKPAEKPSYPTSGWGTGRDKMAMDALDKYGKELLAANPKDASSWCGNFANVDKARFYTGLMSALAKYESGWRSDEKYTEAFADAKGVKVVSRGLLQISQESANGYGCGITKAEQLHDDATNIACGVRIWNRWIVRDNQIGDGINGDGWKGAERYHSPFRKPDHIAVMKAAVKGICQ